MSGKHLAHFAVIEAVETAKVCPLCWLEDRAMGRYFDAILLEHVNAPHVREELKRSGGYCPEHAARLIRHSDALGTAILYADQIRLALDELDRAESTLRRRRSPSGGHPKAGACPACRAKTQASQRHLTAMLELLGDMDFRSKLRASFGLCVPHLRAVAGMVKDAEQRRFLIELHREKWTALLHDLQELIRKHDYRFRSEELGPEADAWIRAVRVVAGLPAER